MSKLLHPPHAGPKQVVDACPAIEFTRWGCHNQLWRWYCHESPCFAYPPGGRHVNLWRMLPLLAILSSSKLEFIIQLLPWTMHAQRWRPQRHAPSTTMTYYGMRVALNPQLHIYMNDTNCIPTLGPCRTLHLWTKNMKNCGDQDFVMHVNILHALKKPMIDNFYEWGG